MCVHKHETCLIWCSFNSVVGFCGEWSGSIKEPVHASQDSIVFLRGLLQECLGDVYFTFKVQHAYNVRFFFLISHLWNWFFVEGSACFWRRQTWGSLRRWSPHFSGFVVTWRSYNLHFFGITKSWFSELSILTYTLGAASSQWADCVYQSRGFQTFWLVGYNGL